MDRNIHKAKISFQVWLTLCFSFHEVTVVVVQLLSCVQLFVTPRTTERQASLSITNSRSLIKHMPSNYLILCCPLLLLTSIFPSIRVFSNELALCIRWPKSWSFHFSISPSNEYFWFPLGLTGLISLQSKGLKSLLQHHSSKASILWCLSHFYGPNLPSVHDYWKKHSLD